MGTSSRNGPFSMAMLNNQRVYKYNHVYKYIHSLGKGELAVLSIITRGQAARINAPRCLASTG